MTLCVPCVSWGVYCSSLCGHVDVKFKTVVLKPSGVDWTLLQIRTVKLLCFWKNWNIWPLTCGQHVATVIIQRAYNQAIVPFFPSTNMAAIQETHQHFHTHTLHQQRNSKKHDSDDFNDDRMNWGTKCDFWYVTCANASVFLFISVGSSEITIYLKIETFCRLGRHASQPWFGKKHLVH